jgi:hypothetical protein
MIEPSETELARWSELWNHPHARIWLHQNQQLAVADLVRLEQRYRRSGRAHRALLHRELTRLRSHLNLSHWPLRPKI